MALDGIETKKQENSSRMYLQYYLERGVKLTQAQIKTIYPNVNAAWMNTFEAQALGMAKFLTNKLYKKGFCYSRDDGIMPFIVKDIANMRCGVQNKDSWNTMDIVMVLSAKQSEIRKNLCAITSGEDKAANLTNLNCYMIECFNKGILYGISLKAIRPKTKIALTEVTNLTKGVTGGIGKFVYTEGSFKCDLGYGQIPRYSDLFNTGEASAAFLVSNKPYGVQHRNFRYSQPRNVVQTDVTGKGAAAKLGKASASKIDAYLTKIGLQRPESPVRDPMIPSVGLWEKTHIDYWDKFYISLQNAKVGKTGINFGNVCVKGHPKGGWRNVLEFAIQQELKGIPDAAGRLSSKLISLRWAKIWSDISALGKLEEWISILYYSAKKEGGSDQGVFIKLAD